MDKFEIEKEIIKEDGIIIGEAALVMHGVIKECSSVCVSDNNYSYDNIDGYRVESLDSLINTIKSKSLINKINVFIRKDNNRSYEDELEGIGINYIAGVDEVGRGPLIGDVVCSCVVLPKSFKIDGLTDSKKLSEEKRNYYYDIICNNALGIGIGRCSSIEIDKYNIYEATKIAMKRAIDDCLTKCKIEHVLIDAMKLDIDIPSTSIVKGDLLSISISAASIIAKVTRDRDMYELDKKYPMYNFKNNKGYPTKDHIKAIEEYGILDCHRRSYGPVKSYLDKEK